MAAVLEVLLQGHVSPHHLLLWLHGTPVGGVLEDLSHLRVEFVPVFLNFLRDQSSIVLQAGIHSGTTPTKAPSSVRATKYVSPGKDHSLRTRSRKHPLVFKGKTLQFSDTDIKGTPSNAQQEVQSTNVDQLLEANSAFNSTVDTSPPAMVPSGCASNSSSPVSRTNSKQGRYNTSTPRRNGYGITPKFDSLRLSPHERHHRGKRQNLEGSDHEGKWDHSFEVKHSEQRLSLGDFITTDIKLADKRKSPLPRDKNRSPVGRASVGWSLRHQEMPKILDIGDEEAFPMVGSTPVQDKQQKRRINPTRIVAASSSQQSKTSLFSQNPKTVFGVPLSKSPSSSFLASEEGSSKSMEKERELLRQERLRRIETGEDVSGSVKNDKRKQSPTSQIQQKLPDKTTNYIQASPDLVSNRSCLDILSEVYAELILYNMAPSVMVELYYLIQLLTVRVILGSEVERGEQCDKFFLDTPHNCVYFATKVLLLITELVKLLDKGTIKLLSENPCILQFSSELQKNLLLFLQSPSRAPMLHLAAKSPIGGVSFQTDTDNRNNFPSDQAFHIFRKQRDLFYEMLRIWEENHLTPGWLYAQGLGSRIRQLLSLRPNSANFTHFARLFQSQLLNMCRGDDDESHLQQDSEGFGFLTLLKKQHPEKYKRLYERLVTPSKLGGPCPPPSFPGSQEFFRDFILTASNFIFNQHLKDVLISHILILSEREFIILEPEDGDCAEARSVVLNLRILAKFLGFLEFLPYQTSEHIPESVMATHISLRSKVCPPLKICEALRQCAISGQLVVAVTWVVEFLSMVDPVALHSRHYLTVVMTLIAIFKLLYIMRPEESAGCPACGASSPARSFSPLNSLLLKLLLGWLFDLPNFPDGLFFVDVAEADIDHWEYSQTLQVLNVNYKCLCVACLRLMLVPSSNRMDKSATLVDGTSSQRTVSPVRDFTATKDPAQTLIKTPSKQKLQGSLMSPTKTPSKFLLVSMLESPQTTPLKASDTQIVAQHMHHLDELDFVDHQMITLCCPFISELKNLLSDYWCGVGSNNVNSYRKITPLSASDRTSSSQSQMQLQLQLEDNFFHNHHSSVRKTTDFVIERLSSNVIKNIRTKIIPELRISAIEKLKEFIDDRIQSTPPSVEWTRDGVQKRIVELSQEMTLQMKTKCFELARQECSDQILPALSLLLPGDVTPQGVEVCKKLVTRCSKDKVLAWIQSHLTPTLFSKDLTADSERLLRQAQKAADLQITTLEASYSDMSLSNLELSEVSGASGTENSSVANQSGPSLLDCHLNSPTNQPSQMKIIPKNGSGEIGCVPTAATEHDHLVPSPSQVLTSLKEMVRVLTVTHTGKLLNTVSEQQIQLVLEDIRSTLTKRQDVTLAVFRALEILTTDFAVAIAACVPNLMNSDTQKIFVSLWKPRKDEGVIPMPGCLNSLLCPRTIMLVAQNPLASHQKLAWRRLGEFISLLISCELLTPASVLDQCVALLRHTWPQEILSGISSCIEGISQTALKERAFQDDPTLLQMLDWVGWVCDQMDDFSDTI
ncbi:codanin-1 [Cherax quadricarinatus]